MARALRKPCSVPGCHELVSGGSRCARHEAAAEALRGTATERGYSSRGHRSFRSEVLARDPYCVICLRRRSTEADHFPLSRKGLIDQGLNPDDPIYGRGLCKRCHSAETARNQPGGWAKQA